MDKLLDDYANRDIIVELKSMRFKVITDREGFIRDLPWIYNNFKGQPFQLLKAFVQKEDETARIEVSERG